jgi:hypothetical protein
MPATIDNPVAAIIRTAMLFRKVREEGGSNRGYVPDFCNWWVIRDMRDYPLGGRGAMWCATWVCTIGRLALGEAWPIPVRAEYSDVDNLVEWAKDNRVFNIGEPNAGDIFVIPSSGGSSWVHTGIVTAILNEQEIETIEGNTNDDGSANGDGVYTRIRNIANLGFIRWERAG